MVLGLGKKKEELPPLPPVNLTGSQPVTQETTTIENVKAKMDLVLSRMDSLRTQQEVLIERVNNAEKILKELYAMAKS